MKRRKWISDQKTLIVLEGLKDHPVGELSAEGGEISAGVAKIAGLESAARCVVPGIEINLRPPRFDNMISPPEPG